MNREDIKNIIRSVLLERESGAAMKAKKAGLAYAQFGRWKDPKTGHVVAKSKGDNLVKVDPVQDTDPETKRSRELDKMNQMKKYQAYGQNVSTGEPGAVPVSDTDTAQSALAKRQTIQQMRQKVNTPPELQPSKIAQMNPDWHNNFVSDVEDTYGLDASEISPRVLDALFKKRLAPDEAAAEYYKIKSNVAARKKEMCKLVHGESIMKESDFRHWVRKQLVEIIGEKWDKDVDVKDTGEHKNKSIEQLKSEIDAIEKKKPFNRGEWSERMFALRAKQGWKKNTGTKG